MQMYKIGMAYRGMSYRYAQSKQKTEKDSKDDLVKKSFSA